MGSELGALFYPDVEFESLYIPNIFAEIYEHRVYEKVALNGTSIVIDIGANIGIVTDYLRKRAWDVYALEPEPENFKALSKNAEHNHWLNVHLFNAGIYTATGMTTLEVNDENRTMTRLSDEGEHEVKVYSLIDFMEENAIDHVDFIKMDIEAAEQLVMRADNWEAAMERVEAIEIEFHDDITFHYALGTMPRWGFTHIDVYHCPNLVVLFRKYGEDDEDEAA